MMSQFSQLLELSAREQALIWLSLETALKNEQSLKTAVANARQTGISEAVISGVTAAANALRNQGAKKPSLNEALAKAMNGGGCCS